MTLDQRMAALEASLRRRFRVVESVAEISGRSVALLHPASAEDLINEADFEQDERLPYWAELWPSARILGERVLAMRGGGRSLLELGCGAGLVTSCAAMAGFSVTASDYYADATAFARLNAWLNVGVEPAALMLDWRKLPSDLPRFDAVLASDVLYERPYGPLVAQVIDAALSDAGFAIVADPGRVGREQFLAELPKLGLTVTVEHALPYVEGEIRQTIGLFEIQRCGRVRQPLS